MKSIIILIFLLLGCREKEFVEPAKTANERFYCEIDGKIFRPRNNGDIFDSVLYTDFNPLDYNISLLAINKLQARNTIALAHSFKETKSNGKYFLETNITTANFLKASSEQYVGQNGYIEITRIDTVSRKISGRFEFTGISKLDATKMVQVKNGEFNNLSY